MIRGETVGNTFRNGAFGMVQDELSVATGSEHPDRLPRGCADLCVFDAELRGDSVKGGVGKRQRGKIGVSDQGDAAVLERGADGRQIGNVDAADLELTASGNRGADDFTAAGGKVEEF